MIAPVVAATIWALAAGIVLSLVLAALVALIVRTARPAAATRHALWCVALIATAAAPIAIAAAILARSGAVPATAVRAPAVAPARAQAGTGRSPATHGAFAMRAVPGLPVPRIGRLADVRLPAAPKVSRTVALALIALWAAGALGGLAGLVRSLLRVRGLKRRSTALEGPLADELPWLTSLPGREIYLRLSYETETPIAVGFRRPVILIPNEMATASGLTAIEPLVMHEYAHLVRYDDWTNLLGRAIERVFWFNPLVWYIGRRVALEREIAADEAVVERTHDPKTYASTLWRLAREMRMPEHVVVAPGALLTRRQITVRIERLLDDAWLARPQLGIAALTVAILATSGVAAFAAVAPTVAFDTVPPAPEMAKAPDAATEPVERAPGFMPFPKPVTAPNALRALPMPHVSTIVRVALQDAGEQLQLPAPTLAPAAPKPPHPPKTGTVAGDVTRDTVAKCGLGCDLSGRDLHGLNLSGVQLFGADLSHANLAGADLSGARLTGVDLSGADLRGTNFHGAQLVGTDLDGAQLTGADFSATHVMGTSFSRLPAGSGAALRAMIDGCIGCDLSGMDLHGTDLHGIKLTGADLHGADLHDSNLHGAKFTGVDLTGADLSHTDLGGARLVGTKLDGATLVGADTTGIRLIGTSLP